MPLANQRYSERDAWLGYYIQSRIKSGLASRKGWAFHSLRTAQLWKAQSKNLSNISPDTTILITGSFQKVLNFGKLSLLYRDYRQNPYREREFDQEFTLSNLDQLIDELTLKIGNFISDDFNKLQLNDGLKVSSDITEEIYKLREVLLDPLKKLNSKKINWLLQQPEIDGQMEAIEDLIESLLILARKAPGIKGKHLLQPVAEMLKKNLVKFPDSAHLIALQGELFYFAKNYDALESAASRAIQIDPRNELALFMLSLSKGLSTGGGKEAMAELVRINPWILAPSLSRNASIYQKGILDKELKKASHYYHRTGNFKP
ncbi:MAG: hypothetical protein GY786_08415 [Proteobacteria bacterium]|nr:hypothetical protein [Pseudomonadota bacterium]